MLKKFIFIAILVIASITAGYAVTVYINRQEEGSKQPSEIGVRVTPGPALQTEPPQKAVDPIKEQLRQLTLDEKIGQMVLVGFDGYEAGENTRVLIQQYHVGGLILFKRNVQNAEQLLKLLNGLKKQNNVNTVPLLLSLDEEGGSVTRMPEEMAKIPTNEKIGALNDRELAYSIGSLLGKEVKAFGFNMDFAPVLDINSNPKNPVIGNRSFGTTEKVVSALGIQTMKGMQSQNVIPVVKHFPGHGDTSVDSHVGLPVVLHGLDRLRKFELIPFAEAVKNQADAVMVAHILLPAIDPDSPASFSKAVITGLLRKELSFAGVVFSDDMTMGAITKNYDIGEAAVKAVTAGTDVILVCHQSDSEIAVLKALKKAVTAGTLTEERIDESVYRILQLKQKYGLQDRPIPAVDVKGINQGIHETVNRYFKEGSAKPSVKAPG